MAHVHLVVGGARSGKSTYAEKYVKGLSEKVLYIATAIVTDADMQARIDKHIAQRPPSWPTLEKYKGFHALASFSEFQASEVILLDCLTIMMTNLMFDVADVDYDNISQERLLAIEQTILDEVHALIHQARLYDKTLVLVSNEVGLGLVPPYKLGNYFRDISGRINQHVAALSDEVTFIAVGLPLKLKGGAV